MFLREIPPVKIDASASTVSTPSWVETTLQIGKGLLSLKQQNDLQRLNLDRLKQGLPALSPSDVAAQVQVGVDNRQLNKVLILGGLGLLGLLFVAIKRRR